MWGYGSGSLSSGAVLKVSLASLKFAEWALVGLGWLEEVKFKSRLSTQLRSNEFPLYVVLPQALGGPSPSHAPHAAGQACRRETHPSPA